MKNKVMINNLNKWREKQEVKDVKLWKISVTHQEHLRTNEIDFKGNINSLSKYKDGRVVPIVVRKTKDGYQLLFGLKQLIIAKLMNYNRIKAVVVGCSRESLCEFLTDKYMEGEWYPIRDIKIQEDFTNTTPGQHKMRLKKREINKGLVPVITINEDGLLFDGYITYLILKEKGVKEINVEIIKGEKAKSYKLRDGVTKEDLENVGFASRKHYRYEGEFMGNMITLTRDIELDIYIEINPMKFDDFKNIEVMDFSFGQPYTPFYGDNYKKYINDLPYLQEVIKRYNEEMDNLGIFEEVK